MRLIFEQNVERADGVCARTLRKELKTATQQLRQLAQEMIRALTATNRMQPGRIPEEYLKFYGAALSRLDEIDLDDPGAFEAVHDISTELMGVHEAIFAMYFDPARKTGTKGQLAPMALN